MKTTDIYSQILEEAEFLIQTRGYNAFSYRDIAQTVRIKTSSIHYYFPNKSDLGKAVVKHHIQNPESYLDNILNDPKISCQKKLDLFFDGVFAKTYLADRRMCLGGMLALMFSLYPRMFRKR